MQTFIGDKGSSHAFVKDWHPWARHAMANVKLYHESGRLDLQTQERICHQTILHPLWIRLPPSPQFIKHFLKSLMAQTEAQDEIVSETVLMAYVSLIQSRDLNQEFTYCHYVLPRGQIVSLKESLYHISQGSTGLRTWQASFAMIEYLSASGILQGQNVLELGSGCGLLGISCAFLGASRVIMTDVPLLQDQIRANVGLNAQSLQSQGCCLPTVQTLDWESDSLQDLNPTLVLCADLVYDPELIPPLVRVLSGLMQSPRAPQVLIAQTIRQRSTMTLFLQSFPNFSKVKTPVDCWFFRDEGEIELYRL